MSPLLLLPLSLLPLLSSSLSPIDCQSYDSSLFLKASAITDMADDILVPSVFKKAIDGFLITIVDEDDGEDAGGGSNTDGSYGTYAFHCDEIFPDGISDIPSNDGSPRCNANGDAISFLLGPMDVIANVACTPPSMRFYSYDNIIATRLTETYPFYPGQNFGDTISYRNINISDSAPDVYDEPVVILHAADSNAARRVRDAYTTIDGINASMISTREISTSTVRLWDRSDGQSWQETKPDILAHISRMSLPNEGFTKAYQAYKKLIWPVRYYMAYDDERSTSPTDPPLIPRYSENVFDEVDKLGHDFEILKESVNKFFTSDLSTSTPYNYTYLATQYVNLSAEGFYDDWDVVLDGKNNDSFVAGTRDGTYGIPICATDAACNLNPNTVAVVIGVLHRDAVSCSYSSVGVSVQNVLTKRYKETHWLMDYDLQGSAERYMHDNSNADLFFAVDFMPPGFCATVSHKWCIEFDPDVVSAPTSYIILGERVYSVEETTVGSSANTTIGAELLVFSQTSNVK